MLSHSILMMFWICFDLLGCVEDEIKHNNFSCLLKFASVSICFVLSATTKNRLKKLFAKSNARIKRIYSVSGPNVCNIVRTPTTFKLKNVMKKCAKIYSTGIDDVLAIL